MAALQDKRICPVSTWDLYRHMLPWVAPDSSTPLLLTTAPPVGKVISASTFRAKFHRAAESAGVSTKHYTSQSLRRGGASLCFQAGDLLEQDQEARHLDVPRGRQIPVPASGIRDTRDPCLPSRPHHPPALGRPKQPARLSKAPSIARSGKASTTCCLARPHPAKFHLFNFVLIYIYFWSYLALHLLMVISPTHYFHLFIYLLTLIRRILHSSMLE